MRVQTQCMAASRVALSPCYPPSLWVTPDYVEQHGSCRTDLSLQIIFPLLPFSQNFLCVKISPLTERQSSPQIRPFAESLSEKLFDTGTTCRGEVGEVSLAAVVNANGTQGPDPSQRRYLCNITSETA